LLVKQLTSFY